MEPEFKDRTPPEQGERITYEGGALHVPQYPIIPFMEGDGIGPDIWRATKRIVDAAVEKAYSSERRIVWFEVLAGQKAFDRLGEWLPEDTVRALDTYHVGIKGPLTTPVGGGIRSLNVTLRQRLDLFACVRPVRYIPGVPSPVKAPEKMNVVIFRENTEDVYAGIEWPMGSAEAGRLIRFLNTELGTLIGSDSGIGVKPISVRRTKNLVRKAIQYALSHDRRKVTLVHKGNIMKYTEGAFKDWGYQLAREEFVDQVVTEEEVRAQYAGKVPAGRIVINDRIADSMFQQILLRPDEYEVLATPNLNGDYLSDACAAQVGGLGLAPGANLSDRIGLFEATHGTAPKYTNLDKVNPGSLTLSGVMMLEFLGWPEAGEMIVRAIERTIMQKRVTYDLERQMTGATRLKTSEFASAIIENME